MVTHTGGYDPIQIVGFHRPTGDERTTFPGMKLIKQGIVFGYRHKFEALIRRFPVTRAILRAVAALAIVATFGLAPAAAQTGQMFGELVGKVTDDQGGVLPGVTVTLSGPAAMGTPTATTNASGLYRFPAVNSGTYTLKFELAGFAPMLREGIVVPVRQTITVDGLMKLASLQETVTVSGSSPTVDVENTKVGARLDQEMLTSVPTSRTI